MLHSIYSLFGIVSILFVIAMIVLVVNILRDVLVLIINFMIETKTYRHKSVYYNKNNKDDFKTKGDK